MLLINSIEWMLHYCIIIFVESVGGCYCGCYNKSKMVFHCALSKNLQISYLSIKFPISLYNLKTSLLVFVLHRFKHFSLVFIPSQFSTNSQTKLKVLLTKSNIRNPITKQQSHTRQQSQTNFRYRSP